MTAGTSDAYSRSRQFFAEAVGLGRASFWANRIIAVACVLGMVVTSGWAIITTKRAEDSVQRYIVYVDSAMNVVGTMPVSTNQDMTDGGFVDFAQRWIANMRSRPKHQQTLVDQRKFVIRTTDKRLYTALHDSLSAADDLLKTSEVIVQEIGANLVGRTGPEATVLVRWTELITNGNNKPQTYTATMRLAYQAPRSRKELDLNPLGIWAVDFQPTLTQDLTP